MNNSEIFNQIAVDIVQALKEHNNAFVSKKLIICLKKVKTIRTQNNFADKRTKYILSEMLTHGINCNKSFKPVKNNFVKKIEETNTASTTENTGQNLRKILNNTKKSENVTYNTMKVKSGTNWAEEDSSDDEETEEVNTEETEEVNTDN